MTNDKYVMDGKEVKLKDILYDFLYGKATVIEIKYDHIRCLTETGGNVKYTLGHGYYYSGKESNRILFWSKPQFEIPKPPKKKVRKYRVVYETIINTHHITQSYYKNKKEFEERECNKNTKFISLIKELYKDVEE